MSNIHIKKKKLAMMVCICITAWGTPPSEVSAY